ncbi:MAG TPA: helix-turn-helix domain-containing protein, partial [Dehalococcoidia bacterium]|nr:helix-turn-helix domain-containing protein [Dehalococcoidia bacterium]
MEGRLVKELRARLGLSQERFARLLEVSFQSVRRWEAGTSRPLPILALRLEELKRQIEAEDEKGGASMKEKRSKPEKGIEVEVNLGGLGGVFKGIGGLFDLVSRMVEEGRTEEALSGEKDILGGKGKAVYGFSVRVGLGGKPIIEQFGNIKDTAAGPQVAETREPLVDVLDEGKGLRVIAELPGVEEKDIHLGLREDVLELTAEKGDRKYHKDLLLPCRASLVRSSYRNGVLEIEL